MDGARAEVKRILPFPCEEVLIFVNDPARYAEWLEPMNSIERVGDGRFRVDVGYFGQRNEHEMRPLEEGAAGLRSTEEGTSLRWTILPKPVGEGRTEITLTYEKGGSGTVFGANADSPLFAVSIEVLAERSLERLERVIAAAAR